MSKPKVDKKDAPRFVWQPGQIVIQRASQAHAGRSEKFHGTKGQPGYPLLHGEDKVTSKGFLSESPEGILREKLDRRAAAGNRASFHGSPGDPGYPALHPGGSKKSGGSTRAQQTAAMHRYTGQGYEEMNTWLRARNEGYDVSDDVKDQVSSLTDLIESQPPLTETRTFSRGISHEFDFREGDTFQDDGFTSLTSNDRIAEDFARDKDSTLLSIRVPKGSKILDVASAGGEKAEGEFILPPGTRFRVVRVFDDPEDLDYGAPLSVNLEVVNDGE